MTLDEIARDALSVLVDDNNVSAYLDKAAEAKLGRPAQFDDAGEDEAYWAAHTDGLRQLLAKMSQLASIGSTH